MHYAVLPLAFSLLAGLGVAQASAEDFRERVSSHRTANTEELTSDVTAEVYFGKDVAARILGRYPMSNDEALLRYVNLVGSAVALHANRPELEFHFAILDTDSVNAYAAPGGYIFVTRGALENMQNEAELAGVLAHEVAHVTQKHIVKALKIRGEEKATPDSGLARLLSGAGDPARVAFAQALDKAVELLFESGLKRQDELEADRVGTLILANTGYNGAALENYIKRISQLKGGEMQVLHATHPPFADRIAQLDHLIQNEGLTGSGPSVTERFQKQVH